jgi:hypothetical protein
MARVWCDKWPRYTGLPLTGLGSFDADAYETPAIAELEGVRFADVLIACCPAGSARI